MWQILNKTFFIPLLIFVFVQYLIVHSVFAQTCSGSSSSACGPIQLAACTQDSYAFNQGWGQYYFCTSSVSDGSGTTCLWEYPGGKATCEACVPTNEHCYLNTSDPACINYFNGTYWITSCPNNDCSISSDTPTAPGGCLQNGAYSYNACTSGCIAYCNAGTANCGSCSTGGVPTNECGTASGSQTCQHNTCSSGACLCTNSNFTQGCSTFINNCSTNYTCPISSGGPVNCQTNVIAHAFMDQNHNGIQDSGEANLQGVTMNRSGTIQYTDSSGNSSFGGLTSGTAVTITGSVTNPFNGINYQTTSISQSVTLSNSNGNTTLNYAFVPTYTVSGHVFIDYNHNGTQDSEDIGYNDTPITVTLSGVGSTTTDGSGNFSFNGVITGSYTLSISGVPATYTTTTTNPLSITVSGNTPNQNFGVTPLYTLSGIIYNDYDAGNCYNPTTSGCTDKSVTPNVTRGPGIDTPYTLSQTTVTVVGDGKTFTLNQSDGTYSTKQVLRSGTYTVSLTTVPTDYHMTYPNNGVPAYFSNINIGTPGKSYACNTNNANDATCDASGNMSYLNFGMNNENGHGGGICTDIRDETSTSQYIPDNATCGVLSGQYYIYGNSSCPTGPSIYFSGTETPDFGHGTANVNNWIAGGATSESFSPVNPGVIRTSSSYLDTTLTQNAITPTDLSTVCTPSDCYLPDNLPSGVYTYPFDTTFVGTKVSGGGNVDGTYTFPTGKNYVFIIGDSTHQSSMTFKTKMLVPNGSTATFTTSKDILVDPSVGESDITSTKGDLEGFYSADESFIIESAYTADNRCTDTGGTKDLRLNIIGSVIVNAAENGGSFVNDRDLCTGDLTCPTYTTGNGDGGDNGGGGAGDTTGTDLGLTYILNAPDLIKHKNTFWQELAP